MYDSMVGFSSVVERRLLKFEVSRYVRQLLALAKEELGTSIEYRFVFSPLRKSVISHRVTRRPIFAGQTYATMENKP